MSNQKINHLLLKIMKRLLFRLLQQLRLMMKKISLLIKKPRRKYTREYLAEHVPFTYDIDGSFSPTTLSWQDYGDYIGGRGTLHFKIVNNTDIDLPLNYEFVTHGMKIPTSARYYK